MYGTAASRIIGTLLKKLAECFRSIFFSLTFLKILFRKSLFFPDYNCPCNHYSIQYHHFYYYCNSNNSIKGANNFAYDNAFINVFLLLLCLLLLLLFLLIHTQEILYFFDNKYKRNYFLKQFVISGKGKYLDLVFMAHTRTRSSSFPLFSR